MELVLLSAAFLVSLGCALAMGFAIQRGATCAVVAVAEVVDKRRFTRLASMIEASLWVLGGLLAARALGALPALPAGYAVDAFTVLGGALLGLGAWINRACAFGTIARLGSGEWSFVATPVGFFAGCVVLGRLHFASPDPLAHGSPVLSASPWIAVPLVALLFVRFVRLSLALRAVHHAAAAPAMRRGLRDVLAARVWSPHAATIVIGIAFVFLFVLAGAWSYTEALAELARGMAHDVIARAVLFAGLLGGALLGGWTAGRFRATRISAGQFLRCFAGGAMMAWGTLLIPGSNDGLILVGMPLLWPYAWVAFATMCVAIGAAQVVAVRSDTLRTRFSAAGSRFRRSARGQ